MQPESQQSDFAPTEAQVRAGQAAYSRPVLAIYDWYVHGLSNRFLWRCPTVNLLELYQRNLTSNHLEVGVGTGYFLDHCRFPTPNPRLVLLDLNQNCLDVTARRVNRYRPATIRANILEPIAYSGELFDSLGINYVLHCVPGTIRTKARVFDHLSALLRPGGVLFGSTLLFQGTRVGFAARQAMRLYNAAGIFCNTEDSLDGLRGVLEERFSAVTVGTVGSAALFEARK